MSPNQLDQTSFNSSPPRTCADCAARDVCLPAGLGAKDTALLERIVIHNRSIKRQEIICRAGSASHSLYAIYSGSVKCTVTDDDGREQVTGLHMSGELIGIDAIHGGKYTCDAVALEDCNVCEIAVGRFERLAREVPTLQRHFQRLMGHEISQSRLKNGYKVLYLNSMNGTFALLRTAAKPWARREESTPSSPCKCTVP